MALRPSTVVIENVSPFHDRGRHPVKRVVGQSLTVEADIFKDGHDIIAACLKWRRCGTPSWHSVLMTQIPEGNDRWTASCVFLENAVFELTIEAWKDAFHTWLHEIEVKVKAGITDIRLELMEGALICEKAAFNAREAQHHEDATSLLSYASAIRDAQSSSILDLLDDSALNGLLECYSERAESSEFYLSSASVRALVETPPLSTSVPLYPRVIVDREAALFSAWYEFFPRSAEGNGSKGSSFRDCLPRIDDAKRMGFDVIYFPPIHPIGITARKGKNNSVTCVPGEPGVPYAIGNRHQNCPNGGGHCDVAPELGSLSDFDWLVDQIHERGMELALDFAINCSPDHPYVSEHPDWFYQRPDGSIKYAENPPKKYQDVFPLNFHNDDWRALWEELTAVVLFWAQRKVRIFRVDNPHTKPVAFWEFLITKVQHSFPDTIFLSEAFTRPKMMLALAKVGFTQSYTYFTWRNTKQELIDYFTSLTETPQSDFFRPNLWPNTPDILPFFLQFGGLPAFVIRFILSATLSPTYGIYSGFELCENLALPDKEEYLDSEKYQFKARDWNAPGNIKPLITRVNEVRKAHRSLRIFDNLTFHYAENDSVLFYSKSSPADNDLLLIVISLDYVNPQETFIHVPLALLNLHEGASYTVRDLLSNDQYLWHGSRNYVSLSPHGKQAHIFTVTKKHVSETEFPDF